VQNLWVIFGKVMALKNLSLEIYSGENVCIIGTNGSGKSTLLRVIAGLQKPTLGRACLTEHDTWKHRRLVWKVVDFLTLAEKLPDVLDTYENLKLFLPDRPAGYLKFKADSFFGEKGLELSEFHRHQRIEDLSTGMRQKVKLATLSDLPITIVDEPTDGLDPNMRSKFRTYLSDRKRTIISVTHDMLDAETADRVFVLDRGHVIGFGKPAILKSWLGAPDIESAYGILTRPGQSPLEVATATVDTDPNVAAGTCWVQSRDGRGPRSRDILVSRIILKCEKHMPLLPSQGASSLHLLLNPADFNQLSPKEKGPIFRTICWLK
jgi:ABC-type multidrug transport system ATPase subunit